MIEKDALLKLVIQQLQFYDMNPLASVLMEATNLNSIGQLPSNELASLVSTALAQPHLQSNMNSDQMITDTNEDIGPCLDIPADSSKVVPARKLEYDTAFVTTHKLPCVTAAFNIDGRYAATGSLDNSLKVLDVEKLKDAVVDEKPVIRTFYDHSAPVNEVAFHPNSRVLASCSDDCSIKMFDLQRATNKRAFRFFQDAVPVKTISFHPSGDYILAGLLIGRLLFVIEGTVDNIVRMYDVQYMKCFSGLGGKDSHELGINQVRYHHTGRLYVTAGDDGDVKIWDAISGQCVNTIPSAHGGGPVYSASITLNGKYVFTCGDDSIPRLWDISSGGCLLKYTGAQSRGGHSIKATLSWNEEYALSADERTKSVYSWCARTGNVLSKLSGHAGPIGNVVSSPTEDLFISCSDDARARFWKAAE